MYNMGYVSELLLSSLSLSIFSEQQVNVETWFFCNGQRTLYCC